MLDHRCRTFPPGVDLPVGEERLRRPGTEVIGGKDAVFAGELVVAQGSKIVGGAQESGRGHRPLVPGVGSLEAWVFVEAPAPR